MLIESLPKEIEEYYFDRSEIDHILSVVRVGELTIVDFKRSKIRHIWKDGQLVEKQGNI